MEYISSDTNVWLDFVTIDRLDYPFRLPYTYLMNNDAVQDELLSPTGLGENLKSLGLQETELTEEEFFLAEEYMSRFSKPSMFDCIALAIAVPMIGKFLIRFANVSATGLSSSS